MRKDFLVSFPSPNPPAEIEIARFSMRTGLQKGCLLKITRDSVRRGFRIGITAEEMLESMGRHAPGGVPAEVSSTILKWADECRWVTADTRVVLTCPDEKTADQMEKAAGKTVARISSTVLSVPDKRALKRLEQLLSGNGIFIQE